jgi:hypothetical protein
MTATNHALTGAAIGLISGQPLIAIPLAILSHYVLDAIPHYEPKDIDNRLNSHFFRNYLILEVLFCFLIVVVLAVSQPAYWPLAAVCAFLAAAPDFFWINFYLKKRSGQPWRPNKYSRFAVKIQWFAKPIGAIVEVVWFAVMAGVILLFI